MSSWVKVKPVARTYFFLGQCMWRRICSIRMVRIYIRGGEGRGKQRDER